MCAHTHKLHSKQRSGNLPVLALYNNAAKPSTLQTTHLLYPHDIYCPHLAAANDAVHFTPMGHEISPVVRTQALTPSSLVGAFQT